MQFYMVGIKGSGMSALANILSDLGHSVQGADYPKKYFTEATFRENIICDSFENVTLNKEYFYIIGNAFKKHEISEKIINSNYQFLYYPEFLENFFKMKKIGVCGSHGKTTTTTFTSTLMNENLNVLIGDGTGKGVKDSEYFLFEACEYQNNFLKYSYDFLVMLNIDFDHPDYFKNETDYFQSFQKAALKADVLICNNDDYYCKKIIHSNKITFGFNPDSDLVIACDAGQIILSFCDEKYAIDFPFYGKHFCYDFAASFLVSILATKKIDSVLKKVQDLYLPRRRLNEYKIDDVILINDYAHHPTEIKAVYNSVKIKYPNKKYISIYQPHTFSRTNAFLENYIEALKLFDQVYIMPIFSSVREENFNEWILLEHCSSFSEYKRELKGKLLEEKDAVIVFMGAGDIDEEIHFFIQSNV